MPNIYPCPSGALMTFNILFLTIMTDPLLSLFYKWENARVRRWKILCTLSKTLKANPSSSRFPWLSAGGAEFAYGTCTPYFLFQTWALPPVPFNLELESTKKKTMQITHENGQWYKACFYHGAHSWCTLTSCLHLMLRTRYMTIFILKLHFIAFLDPLLSFTKVFHVKRQR